MYGVVRSGWEVWGGEVGRGGEERIDVILVMVVV